MRRKKKQKKEPILLYMIGLLGATVIVSGLLLATVSHLLSIYGG